MRAFVRVGIVRPATVMCEVGRSMHYVPCVALKLDALSPIRVGLSAQGLGQSQRTQSHTDNKATRMGVKSRNILYFYLSSLARENLTQLQQLGKQRSPVQSSQFKAAVQVGFHLPFATIVLLTLVLGTDVVGRL